MPILQIADIEIEIERKHIKNLHLYVLPDGRVRATVPLRLADTEIERFIKEKLLWIKHKKQLYENRVVPQQHKYISGEIVPVWGNSFELAVEQSSYNGIQIRNNMLCLLIKDTQDDKLREQIINEWYRNQLETAIPAAVNKYQRICGVSAKEWRIKNMKTRWGTCNIQDRRIWLNLRLAKKQPVCLEYVIAHELTHLIERGHNARFYGYMDKFMPEWRTIKAELNKAADYIND